MLKIAIRAGEFYDEASERFIQTTGCVLMLEHSLLSISKWESKWHKPFITDQEKTREESIDYVRCMTINRDVDPLVYLLIDSEQFARINAYMEDKMTATWFGEKAGAGKINREVVTSEVIYYWMVTLGIPLECEKWHLNRLLTLVRVCNEKNAPDKKMGRKEQMNQQRVLNAARRQRLHSKG